MPRGSTRAIYIGSADGSLYALRPDGSLIWRYDTGDPIRSSPAVGRGPNGSGDIVYVGSSNGRLYAIDAATGKRRWSFDTTPAGGALRDRNDLNGSPALGRHGIYIGGEHGYLVYVPYDYCLHRRDRRCERSPAQEFGNSLDDVFYVTPGGTTRRRPEGTVTTSTVLGTRLIVRRGGITENAKMVPAPDSDALVQASPRFGFQTQLSGDGHFLFIRPDGFLRPGTRLPGAGRGRLGRGSGFGRVRHHDPLPHGARRGLAAAGGRQAPGRRAEDQPPGAAAALAAAERQPDRLRQLRHDRRHPAQDPAGPERGGADPDVGGRGAPRRRA